MAKNKVEDEGLNTEKMEQAAETAPLETGTLVGDLRDAFLEVIKNRPKPWDAMPQEEQRDVIAAAEHAARVLVEDAVALIRADGQQSIKALLKGYNDGGQIAVRLEISRAEVEANPSVILTLHNAVGKYVMITNASDMPYKGTRGEAETLPDQPELPEFDTGNDAEFDGDDNGLDDTAEQLD